MLTNLKILIVVFMMMLLYSCDDKSDLEIKNSKVIKAVYQMEDIAQEAEKEYKYLRENNQFFDSDEEIKFEDKYTLKMEQYIKSFNEPQELFLMVVLLNEIYPVWEDIKSRLMFSAAALTVIELAKKGDDLSYRYFEALNKAYGFDGGESMIYRGMKFKYFPDKITEEDIKLNKPFEIREKEAH